MDLFYNIIDFFNLLVTHFLVLTIKFSKYCKGEQSMRWIWKSNFGNYLMLKLTIYREKHKRSPNLTPSRNQTYPKIV